MQEIEKSIRALPLSLLRATHGYALSPLRGLKLTTRKNTIFYFCENIESDFGIIEIKIYNL